MDFLYRLNSWVSLWEIHSYLMKRMAATTHLIYIILNQKKKAKCSVVKPDLNKRNVRVNRLAACVTRGILDINNWHKKELLTNVLRSSDTANSLLLSNYIMHSWSDFSYAKPSTPSFFLNKKKSKAKTRKIPKRTPTKKPIVCPNVLSKALLSKRKWLEIPQLSLSMDC